MSFTCGEDELESAVWCCVCTTPAIPLCERCAYKHEKFKSGFHFLLPLDARSLIDPAKVRPYLFCLKEKYSLLQTRYKEFKASRKKIEAACAEAIDLIAEMRESLLSQFDAARRAFRDEVWCTVKEIREHALDAAWEPPASSSARNLLAEDASEKLMFDCSANCEASVLQAALRVSFWWYRGEEVSTPNVVADLQRQVEALLSACGEKDLAIAQLQEQVDSLKRKLDGSDRSSRLERTHTLPTTVNHSKLLAVPRLPLVDSWYFGYFDCSKENWIEGVKMSRRISCSDSSSYVLVDHRNIFTCGGGSVNAELAATYITRSGLWVALSDMRLPRSFHTCVKLDNCVYAFGGRSASYTLDEIDRFSLSEERWEGVTRMSVRRSRFVAATLQDRVYLCGGAEGNKSIEEFRPPTDIRTLQVRLPEGEQALAVADKDQLVVLTSKWLVKYRNNCGDLEERESLKHNQSHFLWSNATPVVYMGVIYTVHQLRCTSYSLISGKKIKEVRLREENCRLF